MVNTEKDLGRTTCDVNDLKWIDSEMAVYGDDDMNLGIQWKIFF